MSVSDPVRPRPELLAPAGDWEALRAAVANGADAVYFGLTNFNARHRASNFTLDELPQVLDYLHAHNVRGYVTFNTLIFSDELPEAVRFIQAIAAAGADAVIVQDLGLARLIHRLAPQLPLHASTQMTLTEPHGLEFVRRLGVERAILSRELSVADVGKIAAATDLPVEVFVHGALCVSYSGQCLTSEALGGRSANRGQCAQACRQPYEMLVDGRHHPLGDRAYLLSPQDLAAHDLIEPLVRLGVACFKIEGRLKSAAYVASATGVYRQALDAALAGQGFTLDAQGRLDLEQGFSRGFSHGFLGGVNHQVLVQGRFPKSRGVRVGRVTGKTARGVLVELADTTLPVESLVKPGDGIVFDEGRPEEQERGGRIFGECRLPGVEDRRSRLPQAHGSDLRPSRRRSAATTKRDPARTGRHGAAGERADRDGAANGGGVAGTAGSGAEASAHRGDGARAVWPARRDAVHAGCGHARSARGDTGAKECAQ
jgi:putative protease